MTTKWPKELGDVEDYFSSPEEVARPRKADLRRGDEPPPWEPDTGDAPRIDALTERPAAADALDAGVSLDDFRAYMPMHAYIYTPTRELWPAGSVNPRVPPIPIFHATRQPRLEYNG